MPRKRTRFTVTVGGRERQVLSIGEGADGGLNLILNRGRQSDHPSGEIIDSGTHKVSVHPSPLSDGYTVKAALSFTTGDIDERTLFIKWADKDLLAPLYGQLCRDLTPDRYAPKPKDKIINIGKYNPKTSALMCFPFVMHASDAFLYKGNLKYNVAEFSIFKIILFHAYVLGPSLNSGSGISFVTSEPRWNKSAVRVENRLVFAGVSVNEIDDVIVDFATKLRKRYIILAERYHGAAVGRFLEAYLTTFGSKPPEELYS